MKIFSSVVVCLLAYLFFTSFTGVNDKYGGVNLYTFREEMKKDAKGTLKQISDAGYKYIEDAGYADGKFNGMTPAEYKAYLAEIGLVPVSSHQGGISYDNADQTIADVKEVGFEYLVVPIPPMGHFTYDPQSRTMGMKGGAKNLADMVNKLAEKCHKAGLKLLYHNHDFEFKTDADGVVPIDYLLQNTDSKYVNFEIDLYWAVKAGADPAQYFKKYPGRFKAWHLKDMDDQGRFAPVGKGKIDFADLAKMKALAGLQYSFVEQDLTFDGMSPLEAVTISHTSIGKLGFRK